MHDKRFDPKKLDKLNNPQRLQDIPLETIWKHLALPEGAVVVDIGAGTAFFSIAALRYGAAKTVYACDVSEVMIDWIKENIVEKYPAIIPLQTADDSMPLPGGIADLVLMINLHHELDAPERLLGESWRLAKPGGRILIIDWKKEEMAEGPPAAIRCSPDRVEAQLRAAGFQEIRVSNLLAKHFIVAGSKT